MFKGIKGIKLVAAIIIIVFVSIQSPLQYFFEGQPLTIEVTAKSKNDDYWQLFYISQKGEQFNETNSIKVQVRKSDSFETVKFKLYKKNIIKFRLDIGSQPSEIVIKDIKARDYESSYIWDLKSNIYLFEYSKDIASVNIQESVLYVNVIGNDPSIISSNVEKIFHSMKSGTKYYFFLCISLLVILICGIYILTTFYKKVAAFLMELIKSRHLIFQLAKKDLQNRYLGSYLGIVWAFIQPMVTILIFWFVFQVGFKSAPIDNFPFVLWLICGMVPWFFFSEALQGATNSVIDNSYLVKKIVFRVSSLPIIRIISSLFIHIFFVFVIFVMFLVYGYKPTIYNIQVVYYLVATIILLLGLSWITSSLVVFLRDLGQIIAIIIQFGFWLTPIFWSFKIMPEKYHFLFKLNPIYYIVEGYRDTFINHIWFWQHYNLTINFWVITLSLFFTGILLFKRLRPHFADVL